MWTDNETDVDFLNFTSTSDIVASIIIQAKDRPVSIGVSGQWGIGKSSMIQLVQQSLKEKSKKEGYNNKFIFIEFNAWLYQGYDDARAALLDVVAEKLQEESQLRKKGVEKAKDFVKRVNWLRVVKTGTGFAPMFFGLPPIGVLSEVVDFAKKIGSSGESNLSKDDVTLAKGLYEKIASKSNGFLRDTSSDSPPREIQVLRDSFEETLREMDATLIVLIDDLDRCLPNTTISTLEAIRLLLFLKNTAFVIAADDKMIKYAVKKHFEGINDDDLVTNYFDKLIQIPIKVPALGIQEVRAYLILLFADDSSLQIEKKNILRKKICEQLSLTWMGRRVDKVFITSLQLDIPGSLMTKFEVAERLAPLMTTTKQINGNPRIIKRFLNALAIRSAIANSIGLSIDEAVLAKLLLLERCGSEKDYQDLVRAVNEDLEGKPRYLEALEKNRPKELNPGQKDFLSEWAKISPNLFDKDLRGALYVGKEHMPLVTSEDRLSAEALALLAGLLESSGMAASLKDELKKLDKEELPTIMDKLLERARQEQEWGTPEILDSCLAVSELDSRAADKLKAFFFERPTSQIKPALIPKIKDQQWAREVFVHWQENKVSQAVINAMKIK